MNPTNIEWCDRTWNPITGCKRGCTYCYARNLHEKRRKAFLAGKKVPAYYQHPFEMIQVHKERFEDKELNRKKSLIVFADSMSDFEYWSRQSKLDILNICCNHSQHTFMFLSKNPIPYSNYVFPDNTMQGLTLDLSQSIECQKGRILYILKKPRPFLSLEPLMGTLKVKFGDVFEKVIVGAMTGKNPVIPQKDWIQSIKDNVPAEKIFWKNNIKPYL